MDEKIVSDNPFENMIKKLDGLKESINNLQQAIEEHAKKLEIVKQTHPFMLTLKDKRVESQHEYALNDIMAEKIKLILEEFHEQTDPNTSLPYLINEDDFSKNNLEQLKVILRLSDNDSNIPKKENELLLDEVTDYGLDYDFDSLFDDIFEFETEDEHSKEYEYSFECCLPKCRYYRYCYGYEQHCIIQKIADLLDTLTPREAKVIRLRFGLSDDDSKGKTLEEIGRVFGFTRERTRQILAKALRKLRHPSRRKKIEHAYGILLENDKRYSKLLSAIFSERLDIEEIKLGIDFSIVNRNIDLQEKNKENIQKELYTDISNVSFLRKYFEKINEFEIHSLAHLLYTPFEKLLDYFTDLEIYEIKQIIEREGYKFIGSDNSDYNTLENALTNKLKEVIFSIRDGEYELHSWKINKLVYWMINNSLSISSLIEDLNKKSLISLSAIEFIEQEFSACFEIKDNNACGEMSIEELGLSVRSYNCLKRAGIKFVEELTEKTIDDMGCVKNLGRKSIEEISDKLASMGLSYKEE